MYLEGTARRLSLLFSQSNMSAFGRLVPVLVVVVIMFALFQLYTALMYLRQGEYAFSAFNLVFSFGGFALARALWTNRSRLR